MVLHSGVDGIEVPVFGCLRSNFADIFVFEESSWSQKYPARPVIEKDLFQIYVSLASSNLDQSWLRQRDFGKGNMLPYSTAPSAGRCKVCPKCPI